MIHSEHSGHESVDAPMEQNAPLPAGRGDGESERPSSQDAGTAAQAAAPGADSPTAAAQSRTADGHGARREGQAQPLSAPVEDTSPIPDGTGRSPGSAPDAPARGGSKRADSHTEPTPPSPADGQADEAGPLLPAMPDAVVGAQPSGKKPALKATPDAITHDTEWEAVNPMADTTDTDPSSTQGEAAKSVGTPDAGLAEREENLSASAPDTPAHGGSKRADSDTEPTPPSPADGQADEAGSPLPSMPDAVVDAQPGGKEPASQTTQAALAARPEEEGQLLSRDNYVTGKELLEAAQKSNKSYNLELIDKALQFARRAHEGQTRRSGEPYVCHPISVAIILIELGMDTESVAAALLHDVVEDTDVDLPTIRREFGADIAMLVDGVTKLTKMPTFSREEQQGENLRKMLLAMSEDIRVIIIKLADRLHNMRTIEAQPPQKRREKSLETLEVYAPIAHRLGIRAVKEELEDLGIRQLDPVGYSEIVAALASREQDRKALLDGIRQQISERLADVAPGAYLEGRVKSIHGIYRKMYMQGHAFDEIYDIYAVRIIVDTVAECYNILGIIHDMFRPIPGRFKDYISTPKPNRYQSLHTTVITRAGVPFEVQIRTWEMHHTAEYGIAAHWKYKEGISRKDDRADERLAWIRQLLESQKESDDVEEIVRTIKSDLAPEEVFVVSPKGDVISLPVGSTVIDFAYAIHSAVGNRMIGAKVDGRIVPIDYQVKTGEIVEILTTSQQGHGPSRDWLKIVKTSEARSKIRSWFKKEKRAENIVEGRAEFDREMRRDMMVLTEEQRNEFIMSFAKQYHCQTIDDFFAMIGYGGLSLQRILPRIKEEYNKRYRAAGQESAPSLETLVDKSKPSRSSDGVVVEGIDNCLVRLSHCCDPLPGDRIIGFITRGHGVSIHKRDCPNVPRDISRAEQPERWVNAYWARSQSESFKSTLQVIANDQPNLIADVTIALANMHVPIYAVNARQLKDGTCQMILTIGSENLIHLGNIMDRLRKVSNVLTVDRM